MLKLGTLFDLAKYLEHTQKFQRTGYGREVVVLGLVLLSFYYVM